MCRIMVNEIRDRKESLLNRLRNKELTVVQIVRQVELDSSHCLAEGYKAAGEVLFNLQELMVKVKGVGKADFIRIYYDNAACEVCKQNRLELEMVDDLDFDRVVTLYACQL